MCGLKQGCLLSPMLFSLYINDLAKEIKFLNKGVHIGESKVSILLYADDIIFLAESEEDLQLMLNCLNQWCAYWQLVVNGLKSNVVHFRCVSSKRSNFKFSCGDISLDVVSQYRYLGVILTEHLDYAVTVKSVSQVASRAFGSLVCKFKHFGGFPYVTYSKLYDSLVWPIVDYSCSIWGTSDYSVINKLHNQLAGFSLELGNMLQMWQCKQKCLGLSLCTGNGLVLLDYIAVYERWTTIGFLWAIEASNNKCHNWYWKIKNHLGN